MHIRLLLIAPVLATFSIAAAAQTVVRIGVLNDLSSVYADAAGLGSVAAAKMAVADSGIEAKGFKVEVLSADHQNKPDVGSTISRRWFDLDGVDAIVDVPNSGVALAVNVLAKEKNKVLLVSSGGTSELTGSACSPNTMCSSSAIVTQGLIWRYMDLCPHSLTGNDLKMIELTELDLFASNNFWSGQ